MKEINEIIEHLEEEVNDLRILGKKFLASEALRQLENAHKVAAKLQGAIDLFKEIEGL